MTDLNLTSADRDAWRDYEFSNLRAAIQYKAMPIAHGQVLADPRRCIPDCGRITRAKDGACNECRRARR